MKNRVRIGTDIGGTFTDFVVIDEATGHMSLEKTLTTPPDPSQAIFNGLQSLRERKHVSLGDCVTLVHGTTLVINALIERKGATTALITTSGFRDLLEMRDELRYDVYDLQIEYPEPLIPRELRHEVAERVGADGQMIVPVLEEDIRKLVPRLRAAGVRAVAVCLLNSHANARNERTVMSILRAEAPDLAVTASHEVLPRIGEYRRVSTTASNAYVKPLISDYLDRLDQGLQARGFAGDLFIMQSGGGVFGKKAAQALPIRILESGPAGGVAAARWWGALCGLTDLLAFDMGGTTAKLCTVADGQALVTERYEAARLHHFKPGSGMAIDVPVLDLLEIGTGGGSVARIDRLGLLKVGPMSAGASPGPACYGLGGQLPTVTDANVVLGYLDPGNFLGGSMTLAPELAARAIMRHIGRGAADADGEAAAQELAYRVHDIANEDMAAAAKLYLAERGKDAGELSMVAYGGAGPGHATALAEKLGITRVLIPPAAGVVSAMGMLVDELSTEQVRTFQKSLDDLALEDIGAVLDIMKRETAAILSSDPAELEFLESLDLRYRGQGFHVNVSLHGLDPHASSLSGMLGRRFAEVYERTYGRIYEDVPVEAANVRIVARVPGRQAIRLPPPRLDPNGGPSPAPRHRQAYFGRRHGSMRCPVHQRSELLAGVVYEGPAFIEERETTIVVRPGNTFEVNDHHVLLIHLDGRRD